VTRASSAPPWLSEDLREHYDALVSAVDVAPEAVPNAVRAVLDGYERDIDLGSIVLYAGTNVMSPTARRFLGTGIGGRPSMGPPGEKYQTGWPAHTERLEVLASELARRIFAVAFAEVRLQSGSLANLAVYAALTEPGDPILALPERAEGHTSHHAVGMAGIHGLRVEEIPFDNRTFSVDLDGLRRTALAIRPRLIVLGASLMLFPPPVAEVAAIAEECGATLLYDAAHVAGLIAGGRLRRPLDDGAHVMTCSTYKSFGGPPGGLILTNDPAIAEAVSRVAYPRMTANYDTGRLATLAVAEAEVLTHWDRYAEACVTNASHLAGSLAEEGFDVAGKDLGFTRTHHVAVDARSLGGGRTAAFRLEPARILLSEIALPWDQPGDPAGGMRIGTQEVTRWGMGLEEMDRIAAWMRRVLLDGQDPEPIGAEVRDLRRSFDRIGYCFDTR
jgi:glycine hydroxymethyltransferase